MKNILPFFLIIPFIFLFAGCSDDEEEVFQIAPLEGVDSIHIDYGSTKLHLISDDSVEDLEATLLFYDGGPGMTVEQGSSNIHIGVKNSAFRLFNFKPMPQLEVRIPESYAGQVIADGTSGTVEGLNLQTDTLQVTGSSGNVTLDFLGLRGDVSVKTSSGNVDVTLNEETPDATISMKSNSGRHSLGLVLDQQDSDSKETSGVSGDGTHDIQLETSSGNISIR